MALDRTLVRRAIEADERSQSRLPAVIHDITELENPNSVTQMKRWLTENGLETNTLGKKAVAEMLKTAPEPVLGKVLSLRQQLAKSSVKKYQAMEHAVCADGRARGMFQFYGANRTGRYSGRLIHCKTYPQNHMPDLEQARDLVRSGNFNALDCSTVRRCCRNSSHRLRAQGRLQADRGDFSAIEAPVISWLAGEQWRNEVFRHPRQDL